nr:MAG TPA: hypothetical protein [Caudoviricetes sp.]
MTEYLTTDTDLKKVADAIREMTGRTDPLSFPDGFVSAIAGGGVANQVWFWNNYPDDSTSVQFDTDFISYGDTYDQISVAVIGPDSIRMRYISSQNDTSVVAYETDGGGWKSDIYKAYRTIIFTTPPTGNLLTYLQANATKM